MILLISKKFLIPETYETQKCSPTNISGTVKRQIFNRKLRHTAITLNSFRYPKLVKHGIVPPWKFLVLWEVITLRQKFPKENRDIPILCLKFSMPEIKETLKCSPAKVLVVWDEKLSTKLWLFYHQYPKKMISESLCNAKGFPYEFFWYSETKNFNRRPWSTHEMLINFRYPKLLKH